MAWYYRQVDTRKRLATVVRTITDGIRSLGGARSTYGNRLQRMFYALTAQGLFGRIHAGYMVKAEGGTDDLGERWPPLQPSTVAARPITEADRRQYALNPNTTRGLLSAEQDKLWRRIFRDKVQALVAKGYHEESEAKPRAAAAAWELLKLMGAKTKKETLSKRRVRILIASGRLEESFRPGVVSGPNYRPYNEDQFFEVRGTGFQFGSKVPWLKYHQAGTRNMPPRPVIPAARTMMPWTRASTGDAMVMVVNEIADDIE